MATIIIEIVSLWRLPENVRPKVLLMENDSNKILVLTENKKTKLSGVRTQTVSAKAQHSDT